MPDLHLIGVHEDGKHVLLADRAGAQFRLPIDDALRSVLRREYVDHSSPAEPLRPTEVQAMIRAGASAAEAAQRAGWPVEKVHRYEGPILAEREHIAQLAGRAHVPATGALHPVTLRDRVDERLEQRGVVADDVDWDSWRSEDGQWTVEVTFAAGGRRRTAAWHFSRSSMTVSAIDDESRWLSGEDHGGSSAGAGAASPERRDDTGGFGSGGFGGQEYGSRDERPHDAREYGRGESGRSGFDAARTMDSGTAGARTTDRSGTRGAGPREGAGAAFGTPQRATAHDPDSELTAGLRERAAARGRRPRRLATSATTSATSTTSTPGVTTDSPSARVDAAPGGSSSDATVSAPEEISPTSPAPTDIPDTGVEPDPDAVPLAPFDYDPATDGLPPGAHSDPEPDGRDGRPESAAAPAQQADVPTATVTAPEAAPVEAAPIAAPKQPAAAPRPSRSVASEGVEEPELPLHHDEPTEHETRPDAGPAARTAPDEAPRADAGPAVATGSDAPEAAAPGRAEESPAAQEPATSTPAEPKTESKAEPETGPKTAATPKTPARSTRKRTAASRRPAAAASGRASKPAAAKPSALASTDASTSGATAATASPAATPKPGPRPDTPAAPAPKAAPSPTAAPAPAAKDPAPATGESSAPAEEASPAPARKASPSRRNRASVPAWDDIMFGAKPPSS